MAKQQLALPPSSSHPHGSRLFLACKSVEGLFFFLCLELSDPVLASQPSCHSGEPQDSASVLSRAGGEEQQPPGEAHSEVSGSTAPFQAARPHSENAATWLHVCCPSAAPAQLPPPCAGAGAPRAQAAPRLPLLRAPRSVRNTLLVRHCQRSASMLTVVIHVSFQAY